MNKNNFCWVIVFALVFCFLGSQAQARYYRYTDKNGNTAFTDDLSKIPESQRGSIESYQSVQSPDVPAPGDLPEEEQPLSQPAAEAEDGDAYDFGAQKEQFEKEYKRLVYQRDELRKEKDLINTPAKQERYNKKVRALNDRIDAFELKIQEYNNRLDR